MKKITFLLFLVVMAIKSYGQCLRPTQFTSATSNNSGLPQIISSCGFTTTNFLVIQNLTVGGNYLFTNMLGSVNKYITVTDLNNTVIAHGFSPLTVTAINSSSVRVHISDDENCGGTASCHTVTVQMILSCPLPTGAVIDNLTPTSVSFSWAADGSVTTWEAIVIPASSPAPAQDLTAGVTTVYDLPEFSTTLAPSTPYKLYYRAVCSDTEKSPWNSSAVFTTLCSFGTYFSEGFDSSTSMPNCFTKVGTQGNVSAQSSSTAASAPNNLYMASEGILSLPPVSNFSAETHRIRFKLKGANTAGGSVLFGYLAVASNPVSFVPLQTFSANSATSYEEYSFEPGAAPETGYFAFRQLGSSAVVLDDIVWEAIPQCSDVINLLTDSYTSSTASFSWTSGEALWHVAYGLAATTSDPNALTLQNVEQTSVQISNLAPNTAYKVWVRSVCSDNGFGAWAGPKLVTTTCAPVTAFSENFNSSGSIPACFKRVGFGGNAYIQSSSLYLSSYLNGNTMSYGMVSLPAVSNAAAGTHRLKFTIKSSGSVGGVVELGYLTNPDDTGTFTAIQSFTSNSTSAQIITYVPPAGQITTEVMALRHRGTPSYTVIIDDIVWETAPNCGDVSGIQVKEISNASAKISWTGTSETDWQVAYGPASVTDPGLLTPVGVEDISTTVINNLDASTSYKVWVRSNCNTLGFGAWIGPVQFTTSCNPVASFSENFDTSTSLPACWTQTGGFLQSGSNPASVPNSIYLGSLNILATPPVTNATAGTHRLRFKARANFALGGVIQVGYLTGYNDATSFVPLQSFSPTSTTTYDEFFVNLGQTPLTGYLALRHSGSSFNAVSVDDIVWEALPTCEEVSQLTDEMITNESATISWIAEYSTAWEIVHTESSSNVGPSELTPSFSAIETFTFTELTPDTDYKCWVRSTCDGGLHSAWVGPLEFRTTCNPVASLPWIEDFENVALPDFPQCWTKGNGTWMAVDQSVQGSNPFVRTNPYSGTKYIRCYNGAVNDYMWTPGFELQANITYDFSTFVQGDGFDGWSVEMVYNTQPKSDGAIRLGAAYELPVGAPFLPYEELSRSFTPTESGVYFFAVKVNENSSGNPFYIAFDYFSFQTRNLSTQEFDTNKLKAYPNPVKDVLNISHAKENITAIEVYNLLGQKIIAKQIQSPTYNLDMSNLASGNYLIRIATENQIKTIRISKE